MSNYVEKELNDIKYRFSSNQIKFILKGGIKNV